VKLSTARVRKRCKTRPARPLRAKRIDRLPCQQQACGPCSPCSLLLIGVPPGPAGSPPPAGTSNAGRSVYRPARPSPGVASSPRSHRVSAGLALGNVGTKKIWACQNPSGFLQGTHWPTTGLLQVLMPEYIGIEHLICFRFHLPHSPTDRRSGHHSPSAECLLCWMKPLAPASPKTIRSGPRTYPEERRVHPPCGGGQEPFVAAGE